MNGTAAEHPDAIELIALDPARNIRRRYAILVSVDLFGAILVETRWGRIGARGQVKRLSFEDPAMADRYIAATLRRRSTSTTRIGVAYKRVEAGSRP
jgi:predicted DNA-binding WGR domain protein